MGPYFNSINLPDLFAQMPGGYVPRPPRTVPGAVWVLIGILIGTMATVLTLRFSPLGPMLVPPPAELIGEPGEPGTPPPE